MLLCTLAWVPPWVVGLVGGLMGRASTAAPPLPPSRLRWLRAFLHFSPAHSSPPPPPRPHHPTPPSHRGDTPAVYVKLPRDCRRCCFACEQGLTQNQSRLLYMISLYSRPARSGSEKEEWIRKQALMVMIYESIVAQVLDYDYAPASEMVEGRRKYFNMSQEGRSDVDLLREEELLNGLKLSSKSYQPVTCYQISEKVWAHSCSSSLTNCVCVVDGARVSCGVRCAPAPNFASLAAGGCPQ
jgi:hypothetical protein